MGKAFKKRKRSRAVLESDSVAMNLSDAVASTPAEHVSGKPDTTVAGENESELEREKEEEEGKDDEDQIVKLVDLKTERKVRAVGTGVTKAGDIVSFVSKRNKTDESAEEERIARRQYASCVVDLGADNPLMMQYVEEKLGAKTKSALAEKVSSEEQAKREEDRLYRVPEELRTKKQEHDEENLTGAPVAMESGIQEVNVNLKAKIDLITQTEQLRRRK